MPSIDDVTDVTPRVQYIAAAGQTEFDYPFPIFEEADLVVDIDGTIKALTTHYTVTGEGEDQGGTIELVDECDGGETVTIYRDTVIERTSDYQQNGPLAAADFNNDLDRLTIIAQEIKALLQQTLRVPRISEATSADTELTASIWANKYLSFDADGIPTPAVLSSTTITKTVLESLLFNVKAYGALGDGSTDDWTAIQNANNAAALVGGTLLFPDGVYMVDVSAHAAALNMTCSWAAQPGANVVIKRKDVTNNTAYLTMQQSGQTGLILQGLTFDGQLTKATSSSPNEDLAAAGSYADTTDESKWRKNYGVDLYNATDAIVDNCTFKNTLRAGLFVRGDGLAGGVSKNIQISNCKIRRTRSGSGGDGLYFGGAQNVQVVNTHVYDYQRIGFVNEFALDASTNCRDITYTNCTAQFGHDVVAPESNVGFWTESGDNITHIGCISWDTSAGFVLNTSSQSDTGTTRPFTAKMTYLGCSSFRSHIGMRSNVGGTRKTHLTVTDFFCEADADAPSYATDSLGLRAGILFEFTEVTSGVTMRADFKNIYVHALNQSDGTLTNGFGCMRFVAGNVTSPQQLEINVDGLQTQWSLTNGNDDVQAKTDYEAATNGYFGDVVFSGENDGGSRFRGHANLRNLKNHTFGYAMVSSEIFSTSSEICISDSRVSLRKASLSNNGLLFLNNCPLVDFRGDVGWTRIKAVNCTFADANTSSKDRTSITCGLFQASNCDFTRQLWINAAGGDSTHRKLRLIASGCEWFVPFDTEPGLRFTLADGTYAAANLSGCVFRNNGTGADDSTDVMILVSTATGTFQFSGAGNSFDQSWIDGDGHLLEYNSTPSYNDDPTTVANAFLTVFGVKQTFDPV